MQHHNSTLLTTQLDGTKIASGNSNAGVQLTYNLAYWRYSYGIMTSKEMRILINIEREGDKVPLSPNLSQILEWVMHSESD